MTEFVCEHVPLNKQTALSVLRVPGPPDSHRIECPCCHVQGYADVGDEPGDCPYCAVVACVVASRDTGVLR